MLKKKKTLVRIEIALFIGDNKHLCFFQASCTRRIVGER